jgi:hypothetical protein
VVEPPVVEPPVVELVETPGPLVSTGSTGGAVLDRRYIGG